jgi:cephalosporin hydroxylase
MPHLKDDEDWPPWGFPSQIEVSDCNHLVVMNELDRLGLEISAIMEIGVSRNGERSLSHTLITHKPLDCVYVGVDVNPKPHMVDHSRNQHMIQANSWQQQLIRTQLAELGVTQLDLLLIDGDHSVNTVLNDWLYTDLVRPGGSVIMHDTNSHPGPVLVFDAVDPIMWHKERYCKENDMGISVLIKRTPIT